MAGVLRPVAEVLQLDFGRWQLLFEAGDSVGSHGGSSDDQVFKRIQRFKV